MKTLAEESELNASRSIAQIRLGSFPQQYRKVQVYLYLHVRHPIVGRYDWRQAKTHCRVPPMALALARHPIVDKANLSSLKEIICGAAPLSADLAAEVTKRVKVPLHQGWGMTETTAASTVNRPGRDKHGSTGQLLPGQQARIVKEDGRDAEVGRDGELWVRGPNIVKSYHNNQKATKGTFTEGGWLMTGDVGFFDAEGYLKIIDRTKELIKYKG